ncbi:MAG: hypothetical protein AB7J46_01565 [Candidatus Altimarinota bacterium]
MRHFLRNLSYISLGILLSIITTTMLPSNIKFVTAQLSSSAVQPLQDPFLNIDQYPNSSRRNQATVPFALPDVFIASILSVSSSVYPRLGPVQMDMNGDGLLDLVFSMSDINPYDPPSYYDQYVLLNTGSGFEVAYICRRDGTLYQGHCADPNYPAP